MFIVFNNFICNIIYLVSTKKVLNLDNYLHFLYKRKSKLFLSFVQQVILGTVLFFEQHQNCIFLFTANGKTKGHHLTIIFYGRSIQHGLGGKRGLEGKNNIIIVFKNMIVRGKLRILLLFQLTIYDLYSYYDSFFHILTHI